MDITTVQGIQEALEKPNNKAMEAILQELLKSKLREAELLAKKASTKKFNTNEAILRSVFVAVRPYIQIDNYDCNATKAFHAVLEVLPITFTKELQQSFFSTSILHCAKSNMLKAKDTDEALNSYGEAVKQAMRLLTSINANDWDDWYLEVKEAKKRADKKRAEAEAVPAEAVPAEAEAVPAEAEAVPAEAVPAKKTIITTNRKRGGKKK